jgi:hypothetical protein
MQVNFAVGDILKFSEDGLNLWLSNTRRLYNPDRYRKWRWIVQGLRQDSDIHGNCMLRLGRFDKNNNGVLETWSPVYFERVKRD